MLFFMEKWRDGKLPDCADREYNLFPILPLFKCSGYEIVQKYNNIRIR